MEQQKIIRLLEFLTNNSNIETTKNGIIIRNAQYDVAIKIDGLPDWNYKIEFALRTETNPFKKLGENKGESFVLPYLIMKPFLDILTEEINIQNNKTIIEQFGVKFFNNKKEEILKILQSNIKIEEEFRHYTLCYETDLFNNVMIIEKPDEIAILNHEFIQLTYTYIISDNEGNDKKPSYKTQSMQLSIPAIEIENYKILSNCFNKPVKNDYTSLIDVLKNNNKDDKMSKLLLYTNLDINLDDRKKIKARTNKI